MNRELLIKISVLTIICLSSAFRINGQSFRSYGSGNWSALSTWEYSTNGGLSWSPAVSIPNVNSESIQILNGHQVTASTVTVDQVTIEAGGALIVPSGITFTIANGIDAIDCNVLGTVTSAGTITPTGNITFGNGGLYQHNRTSAGVIPSSTWSEGSTCEIVGSTTGSNMTGLNQNFHHFVWNCAAQTGPFNMTGALATVNGNFHVKNTGTSELRLTGATNLALSIKGDFIIGGNTTGGNSNVDMCNGAAASAFVFLKGSLIVSAGRIACSNIVNQRVIYFDSNLGNIQDINITTPLVAFPNAFDFAINTSNGSKVRLLTNVTSLGNLECSAGSALDFQTFVWGGTQAIGKTFYAWSGAHLISANTNATGAFNLTGANGSIQLTGTRTFNGAHFTFNGTAPQKTGSGVTTTGSSGVTTIGNLTINNVGSTVSLTNNCTMSGILTMTNGKLLLGNFSLSMTNNSPSAVVGGSADTHIVTGDPFGTPSTLGKLSRKITTTTFPATYVFPVGNNTGYQPMTLTFTANSTSRAVTVYAMNGTEPSVSTSPSYLANRYWITDLSLATGTYSYSAVFGFPASDVVGGFSSLQLYKANTSWTDTGSSATATSVTSSALTNVTAPLNGSATWTMKFGIVVSPTDDDGDGFSVAQGDCDDSNPNINPSEIEICYNLIDENCDGLLNNGCDMDGDGFLDAVDCAPAIPGIYPGANEICGNGIDEDCSGTDLTCVAILGCTNSIACNYNSSATQDDDSCVLPLTPAVTISSSDADNTICLGDVVIFTAIPTNGGPSPIYQWKLNGANVGTNSATFTNNSLTSGAVVTVVMTANNACQTTATAYGNGITTLVSPTVTPSVSILSSDADNVICSGSSVTFTATTTNGGSAPTFQWKLNGANVGSNLSSYTTNTLTNGAGVSLEMTSNNACQASGVAISNNILNIVSASLTPIVNISSSDSDNSICQGTSVTFTATPTFGGSNPVYQWKLNGTNVGINSSVYSNSSLVSGDIVSVTMSANNICQTSSTANSGSIIMSLLPNTPWYIDADGDGYGNVQIELASCSAISGYAQNSSDCNDSNSAINPSAIELCNDGIDNDCNGISENCSYVVINEVDCDQAGPDAKEFVELYGTPNMSLNGYSIVFFNGNNSLAYASYDLDGFSLDANGFFVLGNPTVPNVDLTFDPGASGFMQNGADAVALYSADATAWPVDALVSSTGLVDAVVYGTADPDATGLLSVLTPGQLQVNEIAGNISECLARVPDGGAPLIVNSYVQQLPTPGTYNSVSGIQGCTNSSACNYNPSATQDNGSCIFPLIPSVTVVSSDADNSICSGVSVTYTATATNGGSAPTYQWKVNGTNATGATSANYSYVPSNGDVVTCVLTANNACQTTASANGNSITTTVWPNAIMTNVNTVNVCSGSSVNLSLTSNLSSTYSWVAAANSQIGGESITPQTGNTINDVLTNTSSAIQNVNYTVTPISTSGTCPGSTQTVTVSVIPNVTLSNPVTQTICSGNTLDYSFTSNIPASYTWSAEDNLNVTGESTTEQNSSSVTNTLVNTSNTAQTVTYNITVFNVLGNCNSISHDLIVTINPTPVILNSTTSICSGSSFGISPTSVIVPAGTTYSWSAPANVNITSGLASGNAQSNISASLVSSASSQTSVTYVVTPTSDLNCIGTNFNVVVTIYPTPIIGNLTDTICSGQAFVVTPDPTLAGNNIPLGTTYSWPTPIGTGFSGGAPQSFEQSSISQILTSNTAEIVTAIYSVTPSTQFGCSGNPFLVIVNINPNPTVTLTSSDADNSICSGTSVTFSATPTNGGSTPSYQWKLNGVNVGTNSATYTNSALTNGAVVTVVMTANNACQTTASANGNSITTTVLNSVTPSISITANSTTVCSGTAVSFTSTPTNGGTAPTYQWKKNGVNISGATSGTYTLSSPANNDVTTLVMTSNNACQTASTATSNAVTLTVSAASTPSVSIVANNTTVCSGTAVNFTATPINGGTTPTYQWKKNGVNITGATAATYSLTSPANNDVITVVMTSNAACVSTTTATSNSVTITVTTGLTTSVSIVADASTVCSGTTVNFTATPTNGGTTPTYQWKKNGVNITGATAATYALTTPANGDAISVVLTSNASCLSTTTATSNVATLVVNNSVTPTVSITAGNNTICSGTSVQFTSAITNGGTTPTYQWKKNGVNISGAISATYSDNALINGDIITLQLTSNAACASSTTASSNSVTMIVSSSVTPSVDISVDATTVCSGTTINLTADPTNGGTTPTYQWKKNGVNITGATAATYALTAPANGDVITVVMTSNASCASTTTATSNAVTITVTTAVTPSVNIVANNTTVCSGTTINFTATPTNGGTTPTYQWKKNGVNITGATAATYALTTPANGDVITVVMTSNASCVSTTTATSNPVTITVTTAVTPGVSIVANNTTVCSGTAVNFIATPTNGGTTPTYQWKKNGVNITGATAATYALTTPANGDVITVVMTSNASCASTSSPTSNALTITVNPNVTYYADADNDGYGDTQISISTCNVTAGYVTSNLDCNDNSTQVNPGAVEVCNNNIDDNCNAQIDENCIVLGCTNSTACNYNPGANTDDGSCVLPVAEICNGLDDNCNNQVDEGLTFMDYYIDQDQDGYGTVLFGNFCQAPMGAYVALNGDCNDADNSIAPNLSESCNSIDDNCNSLIDEGLTVTSIQPISVSTALYPTCSGNALKSANLNSGANSDLIPGNGLDLWYSITAEYNNLRASLSAAYGDNEIRLYSYNNGCFELLETEHEVYTTTSLGTGNQVLISDNLIPGQTYYIAVHNISGQINASAKMCFNHFVGTTCDHYYSNYTGIYNNVCTSFKAQYKGNATNYIFDVLSATQNNANLNITPWSYTTTTANSVVPRLGTIFPVNMSASAKVYTLRIPVIYAIPDAAGNYTSITANATTTCTVTLNAELPVALRAVDRCPNTKSTTSSISIDRTICGALRYEWEFTQQLPSVQPAVTVLGGLNTTVFFLNNVPGMGTGKTYNVRVRPIHTNGEVGSWGTVQCLKTGTAGMVLENHPGSAGAGEWANSGTVEWANNYSPKLEGRYTLYPNPTSNGRFILTASNTSDEEVKDIQMIDITGKMVFQTQVVLNGNAVEIEFGNLASGLYVVMVGEERLRLVIQ